MCFKEPDISYLSKIGVKDSKKLTAQKRKSLAKLIKESCHSFKIIVVPPEEIDLREEKRITLNKLEEIKMAEIIRELKPDSIYIDAVDVNETRFTQSILSLLNYHPKEIISKHKADDLFPIVSAASIIAKDKRDALIDELKEKYGDFGSGYPSDLKTINFLHEWIRKKQKIPPFARKSWDTIRKIVDEELGNKKITDFF